MRRGLFASIRSLFLLGLLLGAVTLWPVRTSPTRHRQTSLELRCAQSEFHAASFSPDGTKVATGESAGYVRLWDADTGTDLGSFEGHTGLVTVVAFSPGGEQVASGSQDGTARIWDIRSGACLAILEGHGFQVQDLTYSHDGRWLVTEGSRTRLWDATQFTLLRDYHDPEAVTKVTFSPDARAVAVTSWADNVTRIESTETGQTLSVLRGHRSPVTSATFGQQGRIATTSMDGTARVWDATTGVCRSVLEGHSGPVYSASFSADAERIVTAGEDGTSRVWDVRGGCVAILAGRYFGSVLRAWFSPDGKLIAVCPSIATPAITKVFDAQTYDPVATLHGSAAMLTTSPFSADGKRLVTIGPNPDSAVRVWDAPQWCAAQGGVDVFGASLCAFFATALALSLWWGARGLKGNGSSEGQDTSK